MTVAMISNMISWCQLMKYDQLFWPCCIRDISKPCSNLFKNYKCFRAWGSSFIFFILCELNVNWELTVASLGSVSDAYFPSSGLRIIRRAVLIRGSFMSDLLMACFVFLFIFYTSFSVSVFSSRLFLLFPFDFFSEDTILSWWLLLRLVF